MKQMLSDCALAGCGWLQVRLSLDLSLRCSSGSTARVERRLARRLVRVEQAMLLCTWTRSICGRRTVWTTNSRGYCVCAKKHSSSGTCSTSTGW